MIALSHRRLVSLLLTLSLAPATIAEEIQRDEMDALMARCQSERQANIEPLRQEAIEDCIERGRGDREFCERYNRDFGERSAHGAPAMFWDLPVCVKADAAERYFRMNPRSQTFNFQ